MNLWKEFGFCAQGSGGGGRVLELGTMKFRFAFWNAHSNCSVEPPGEGGKAGAPDTGRPNKNSKNAEEISCLQEQVQALGFLEQVLTPVFSQTPVVPFLHAPQDSII